MPTVGVLSVGVKGTLGGPGGLQSVLGQAGAAVSKFRATLAGLGGALLGSAILRDIGQIAQDIDGLAERAVRMGVEVSKLGGLQLAAERGGMSVQQLETSVVKFTKGIQEAARGTGAAERALGELGLNAKDLVKMPLDQRLGAVADKMAGVADETARLEIALNLFGKSGAGMLNMLGEGSAGLAEFQKEAEKLGIVIGDEQAEQVGRFADAMDRLKAVTQGFKNQIVISIAPEAADILEGITELQGFMRGEMARQGITADASARSGEFGAPGWMQRFFPTYAKAWNAVGNTVFEGMAVGAGDRIRPEEITVPRGSLAAREQMDAIQDAMAAGAAKTLGIDLSKALNLETLKTASKGAVDGLQGLLKGAADAKQAAESWMIKDIWRTMWGPQTQIEEAKKEEREAKERPAIEALERGTVAAAQKIDEILRANPAEQVARQQLQEAQEQTRLMEQFVQAIESGSPLLLADL